MKIISLLRQQEIYYFFLQIIRIVVEQKFTILKEFLKTTIAQQKCRIVVEQKKSDFFLSNILTDIIDSLRLFDENN